MAAEQLIVKKNRVFELHQIRTRLQMKKKMACNKCEGTKCWLGHFKLVLTSKLATAGRQARSIATIKKKVGADHVVSAM